jgi:hypothetical protein
VSNPEHDPENETFSYVSQRDLTRWFSATVTESIAPPPATPREAPRSVSSCFRRPEHAPGALGSSERFLQQGKTELHDEGELGAGAAPVYLSIDLEAHHAGVLDLDIVIRSENCMGAAFHRVRRHFLRWAPPDAEARTELTAPRISANVVSNGVPTTVSIPADTCEIVGLHGAECGFRAPTVHVDSTDASKLRIEIPSSPIVPTAFICRTTILSGAKG